AGLPVAISYITVPRLNKSLRESGCSPRNCSGERYGTVPLRQGRAASLRGRGDGGGVAIARALGHSHYSRQAEIEYFRLAFIRHENIPRLDVSMGNSQLMSCLQPIGNLSRQLNEPSRRQRPTSNTGSQCLATQ